MIEKGFLKDKTNVLTQLCLTIIANIHTVKKNSA